MWQVRRLQEKSGWRSDTRAPGHATSLSEGLLLHQDGTDLSFQCNCNPHCIPDNLQTAWSMCQGTWVLDLCYPLTLSKSLTCLSLSKQCHNSFMRQNSHILKFTPLKVSNTLVFSIFTDSGNYRQYGFFCWMNQKFQCQAVFWINSSDPLLQIYEIGTTILSFSRKVNCGLDSIPYLIYH